MPEVDSLSISISAEAKSAIDSLDKLSAKLETLSNALKGIKVGNISSEFSKLAKVNAFSGIEKSTESLRKTVKLADLSAEKFDKTLNSLKMPEIGEDKLPKLESKLKSVESRAKNLSYELKKGLSFGTIDVGDNAFRKFAVKIKEAELESDALRQKISQVKDTAAKTAKESAAAFEKNLGNLKIPEIRTESLDKLERELAKAQADLDKFQTKLQNDITMGRITASFEDSGYRKAREQIALTEKRIESINRKMQGAGRGASSAGISKFAAAASNAISGLSKTASKASTIIKGALKGIASAISGAFGKIAQLGKNAAVATEKAAGRIASAFTRIGSSSKGLKTASVNLGSLIKTAIGLRGLQALTSFTKNAITLGSDITEVENVVDVAFGNMAQYAYDFASTATEQFGLSELAAKQYSGTMMAMLKSSGVAQGAAAEMSTTLAGLAGDLASFYNIDTEDAFYKIRAGIAGMVAPLRQLGINMTVANLEAYAMSEGITKAYKEMSQAEKTMLRYNYLLSVTTAQQGDFARTAGTWANQWRLLKLNIQSVAAVIGQGLIAAILPAIKWLNALMSKLMEAAKTFRNFMYTLMGKKLEGSTGGAVGNLGDIDTGLGDVGDSAEEAGKKIKKNLLTLPFDELNILTESTDDLSDSLDDIDTGGIDPDLWGDLGKADVETPINEWAKRIRDAFLAHDWEGLGKVIAELVNNGLQALYNAIKRITPKVEKALKNLAKVINSFVKYIDWDLLGRTIGAGINLLVKAFNALTGDDGINFEQLGQKLSVGLRGMIDEVNWRELGNAIGNGFMIAWRIAYGFIEDMWRIDPKTLLTGWAEAGNALGDTIAGIFERIDFEKISTVITEGFKGILETATYALNRLSENLDWIVDKVNLGLDRLYDGMKWDSTAGENMGQKITALTDSISKAFNKLLNLDFGKVGKIIGAGITDIVRAFNQLTDISGGMDFEKLGANISDAIRGLITEIPWDEFGNALGNGFMVSWRILDGFLTDMAKKSNSGLTGWQELGKSIANTINGLFEKIDFSKIASVITRFVNGIFSMLKQAVADIRWDDIANNLADGFNTLINDINWAENGEALNNFLEEFIGMLLKAAQNIEWEKLGRGIAEFLGKIDWGKHLASVAKIAMEVFGGLLNGLSSTPAGKLAAGLVKALLAIKFSSILSPVAKSITSALSGLIEGKIMESVIQKSVSNALQNSAVGITSATAEGAATSGGGILATVGSIAKTFSGIASVIGGFSLAIKSFFDMLKDGFNWLDEALMVLGTAITAVGAVILGAPAAVAAAVAGVVAAVATGVVLIKENWTQVKEFFAGVWQGIQETTQNVWAGLTEFLSTTWENIRLTAETAWSGIKEVFSGIWDGIQETAQTVWEMLHAFLTETWHSIRSTAEEVWAGIGEFFAGVWNGIQENAKSVWQSVSSTLETAWNGIKSFAESTWTAIITFLKDTWSGIKSTAESIWDDIADFFSGVWSGIQDTAKSAWEMISSTLKDAWDGIRSSAETIWNGIANFFKDVWDGIKETAHSAWSDIKSTLENMWEGIKSTAKSIWSEISNYFKNVWNGVKQNAQERWGEVKSYLEQTWSGIKSTAESVWSSIRETVGKAWDGIKEKAHSAWSGIADEVKSFAEKAFNSVKDIPTKLYDTLKDVPNKMKESGGNIIGGLVEGISSVAGKVYDKVAEIAGNVADKFRDILGIHSPSRVFFELAEYTMQGFANGMEAMENVLGSTATSVAKGIGESFSSTLNGNIQMATPDFGNIEKSYDVRKNVYSDATIRDSGIIGEIEEASYRGFSRANTENTEEASLLRELIEAVKEGKSIVVDGRELAAAVNERTVRNGYAF